MNNTTQQLLQLAAHHFKIDVSTLNPKDDFFEKLKINSIQALSLLTQIEQAFNIEIPDYELQGVNTFESLASLIDRRRSC